MADHMNMNPPTNKKLLGADSRVIRKIITLFLLIGILTFVIAIGAVYGGKLLNERFGTHPWLLIICGFLGILVAMIITVSITCRALRSIREILNLPAAPSKEENK
jgi:F0F1-type ATP synthase assembly protein I